MRIAVISDIHGNIGALEAVLADIETREVGAIVNLGDALSGPLFPAECADRLMSLSIPTIRGNHERQLLTLAAEEMGPSDRYTASCLRSDHFEWIAGLPFTLRLYDEVLLVHGTPDSDLMYFLETVDEDGLRPASIQEIKSRATGTDAALILCGHTHMPRSFRLDDDLLIVNPGSVGMPAYEDDRPFVHKVEAGSPHARYAIVERRDERWSAELRTVVYDWEGAADVADQRGRLDWARALRTGLA
jgi:predicted phosphodiesterase